MENKKVTIYASTKQDTKEQVIANTNSLISTISSYCTSKFSGREAMLGFAYMGIIGELLELKESILQEKYDSKGIQRIREEFSDIFWFFNLLLWCLFSDNRIVIDMYSFNVYSNPTIHYTKTLVPIIRHNLILSSIDSALRVINGSANTLKRLIYCRESKSIPKPFELNSLLNAIGDVLKNGPSTHTQHALTVNMKLSGLYNNDDSNVVKKVFNI